LFQKLIHSEVDGGGSVGGEGRVIRIATGCTKIWDFTRFKYDRALDEKTAHY